MATRLDLRSSLRTALEDTSVTPLWADAALNDFLTHATRTYGVRFPRELTAALAIVAATTSYALPAGVGRVVALIDDEGRLLPRTLDAGALPPPATSYAQAWSTFGGSISLDAPPPTSASWTIRHQAPPVLPADDVTVLTIPDEDLPIVITLAEASALRRRVTEDAKRGSSRSSGSLDLARRADTAELRARELIDDRRRRARGGSLS